MYAVGLTLEGKKQHCGHHCHNQAVEHDLGEQPLDDDAHHDYGEGQNQHAPHGAAGVFAVSDVADQNQNHLEHGDDITQRVERAAAVNTVVVKIKQPAVPEVCDDHRQKNQEQGDQTDAGIYHAVVVMGMFQNLGEQIKGKGGCGDDVHQKVDRVDGNVQPERNVILSDHPD